MCLAQRSLPQYQPSGDNCPKSNKKTGPETPAPTSESWEFPFFYRKKIGTVFEAVSGPIPFL